MGMVSRTHCRTAHRRADAQVTLTTGFTKLDVTVIHIPYLTEKLGIEVQFASDCIGAEANEIDWAG